MALHSMRNSYSFIPILSSGLHGQGEETFFNIRSEAIDDTIP
jgi:hypothetical protein